MNGIIDYSTGQKEAASRVLVELCSLLEQYGNHILIIGGWVPELMFPKSGHIGSIDVDLLIDHRALKKSSYRTLARMLLDNSYKRHPKQFFTFTKRLEIDNVVYDVDVDILAGMYGGTADNRWSQHAQGLKALKISGGDFAFQYTPMKIRRELQRPDGAFEISTLRVIAVVPFLVLKTKALANRKKEKDAYDLYFVIKNFPGGPHTLGMEFELCKDHDLVLEMRRTLSEKFSSENHAGPVDVSNFMNLLDAGEIARVRRDVFEHIQALLQSINDLK